MNWDAIGAAGEILGALAVVISIGYLSIQIRSNTRATRASAGFDAMHSWADSNQWVVGLEPELKSNIVKAMSPDYSWNDFTSGERLDITIAHRSLFQKLEGQYFLHKYEFLDDSIWETRGAWAASLISLPFFQEWWRQEKLQHVYTDHFINAVETAKVFDMQVAGVGDGAT